MTPPRFESLALEMRECDIGELHYDAVWKPVEGQFRVRIRGAGPEGNRPLLGTIMLTNDEWESVVTAANRVP